MKPATAEAAIAVFAMIGLVVTLITAAFALGHLLQWAFS